jgi:branched-chain amino acid transport system substrate-binding protein
MKKARVFFLAFFCLSLFMFIPSGGAQEAIKIGALFPFSGGLALLGNETFNGADLAREMINRKGGIKGKKIEWVKGDAVDTKAAMSEAERLIGIEKVKLAFGTYSSSLSYAASAVAEKNNVIHWEQGAISDPITQRGFKYLFRTCPMASQTANAAIEMVEKAVVPKLGIPLNNLKIAVIYEDTLYGTTLGTSAARAAVEKGIKVALTESYSSKSVDFTSLVMRLKAANPDILFAVTYIEDGILFYRTIQSMNFNVKCLIGSGTLFTMPTFPETFGDKVSGVIGYDPPSTINAAAVRREVSPSFEEWREKFKSKTGHYPLTHATLGYTSAMILFQQVLPNLNALAPLDPEEIKKVALQVDIPDGGTVSGYGCKFAPPEHPNAGQNVRAFMTGFQWQGKEIFTVWPKFVATKEILLPFPTWQERGK